MVEAILGLPEGTHTAVKYTSVLLLGELCEWIEKHEAFLDPILNFLVCCLPQQGVGAAAAIALQNICATCNEHMPRHVPIMLQLLHQVDTFAITNNAVIGLLKGTGQRDKFNKFNNIVLCRCGVDNRLHEPSGIDDRTARVVFHATEPALSVN